MNLGILGGTFNPPHNGHLIVAEHVREELGLEKILFVPSEISPHKRHVEMVSSKNRLEMVRLAIAGNVAFDISDAEIERGGVSYTVETLQALKATHARDILHLLIGMDNLAEFYSWKDPQRILELANFVVMTRPDFTMLDVDPSIREKVRICAVPEIGISSREIRGRVKEGMSIRYLVPDTVGEYIHRHKLYK